MSNPFNVVKDLKLQAEKMFVLGTDSRRTPTIKKKRDMSDGLSKIIIEFKHYIDTFSQDELFKLASTVNPDRSFYLSGDITRRFIDLIINFVGYISYSVDINVNASMEIHEDYENYLINIFSKSPKLIELMYIDSVHSSMDTYSCIHRDHYASGLNWRMNNLIMTGFFKLYQHLITSKIQRSHLYYFLALVMNGMDERRDLSQPNVFIPGFYRTDVIHIIKKLYKITLSERRQIEFLKMFIADPQFIKRFLGYIGIYEYTIYVTDTGASVRNDGFLDLSHRENHPVMLTPHEIVAILRGRPYRDRLYLDRRQYRDRLTRPPHDTTHLSSLDDKKTSSSSGRSEDISDTSTQQSSFSDNDIVTDSECFPKYT